VLAILLVLDAVVIGFFLLSVADAIPASGLVLDFLNPNGEANVFVAYSAIKLAFCAFVLAACAIAQRRYVLLIVAMIPLLMAVDEIGQVHENVGNYLPAGQYIATVKYQSAEGSPAEIGLIDVVLNSDVPNKISLPHTGGAPSTATISFDVSDPASVVEVRSYITSESDAEITHLTISRTQ